jgi:predicted Mrr-cat superfamily restriction endonuclease
MDEIKNKYGIEMIGKEMWVWDNNQEDAFLWLVIYKKPETNFPYITIDKDGDREFFKYASETNPNEPQEPQVGDIGYFWDFQKAYAYGELIKIYEKQTHKYAVCTNSFFINFSKEKQPWMK